MAAILMSRFSSRKETSCLPLLNVGFAPRASGTDSPADWMPTDKLSGLKRIKLKTWTSIARPYDERAFKPTWPHFCLAFVPASGHIQVYCRYIRCSDTGKRFFNRTEASCLPLLNAGSNPGSLEPNLWQTEFPLTNRLSYWENLDSIARPYDQRAFSPLDPLPVGFRIWRWRYTCLSLLISMLWHRQAIFESKGDKLSSSAERRTRTRVSGTESLTDRMPADKRLSHRASC